MSSYECITYEEADGIATLPSTGPTSTTRSALTQIDEVQDVWRKRPFQ